MIVICGNKNKNNDNHSNNLGGVVFFVGGVSESQVRSQL